MSDKTEALAGLTVLDTSGSPVSVGSLWSEKAAVIGFVRHFG